MRMDIPDELLKYDLMTSNGVHCDAILFNWRLVRAFGVGPQWVIGGGILGDSKKRFANGELICTSPVEIIDFEEGWAKTKNTYYKLVNQSETY